MHVVASTFWQVSSQAPALILASALALSIDYSLFLLSRFDTELHARRRPYREDPILRHGVSGCLNAFHSGTELNQLNHRRDLSGFNIVSHLSARVNSHPVASGCQNS